MPLAVKMLVYTHKVHTGKFKVIFFLSLSEKALYRIAFYEIFVGLAAKTYVPM